jgi:hypothetical protein
MGHVFISERLEKKGLQLIPLFALHDDANLYHVMCLQHCGDVEYSTNEYVRNANRADAINKLRAFFELATRIQPHILMTPEYSCPWEALEHALQSNLVPQDGKLWQIGCESIKPRELTQFLDRNQNVEWFCEEDLLEGDKKGFLDPIVFIFNVQNNEGNTKVVGTIQFKQTPMGGNVFERDSLIFGSVRYIFENPNPGVRLAALICSESIDCPLDKELPGLNRPYLILHPQMNLRPFYGAFRGYRGTIYNRNNNDVEVMCLNWASGFKLLPDQVSMYGGSCLYMKNTEIDQRDDRINENHKKGLYFTNLEEHRAGNFYLNYLEGISHFRTTKSSQNRGPAAGSKKTGPEMLDYYRWDAQNRNWGPLESVDDDFTNYCQSIAQDLDPLTSDALTMLDRERLLSLSVGEIGGSEKAKKDNWHTPSFLDSFSINENEDINRVTFLQHPCEEAKERRRRNINKFRSFKSTIITSQNFPLPINDLMSDCEIRYPIFDSQARQKYHLNLSSRCGNRHATGLYIGGDTDEAMAQRTFDKVSNLLPEDSEKRRLVVWYSENNKVKFYTPYKRPTLDQVLPKDPREIVRESYHE